MRFLSTLAGCLILTGAVPALPHPDELLDDAFALGAAADDWESSDDDASLAASGGAADYWRDILGPPTTTSLRPPRNASRFDETDDDYNELSATKHHPKDGPRPQICPLGEDMGYEIPLPGTCPRDMLIPYRLLPRCHHHCFKPDLWTGDGKPRDSHPFSALAPHHSKGVRLIGTLVRKLTVEKFCKYPSVLRRWTAESLDYCLMDCRRCKTCRLRLANWFRYLCSTLR